MSWENGTITGYVNGKPVKTVRFVSDPVATTLEVVADRDTIAAKGRDSVRVIVRALDQAGHKLPFFSEPVEIAVTGAAARVGPGLVPLRAGSTGFWLESTGEPGAITVTVTSPRLGATVLELKAQ
jgi:beta-galactosidase